MTKTTSDTDIYAGKDTPKAGHNSGFAREHLVSFVERLERLDEERKGLVEGMKEVMGEAKGMGFDTKILRKVMALRKMDKADRQEMLELIDTYMSALEGE